MSLEAALLDDLTVFQIERKINCKDACSSLKNPGGSFLHAILLELVSLGRTSA